MQSNADQSAVNRPRERRFNVHEAASILGITPEAVRARIQRGTLPKEKDADGAVYVRLNGDQVGDESPSDPANPALVGALQERIEHLSKIIDTRDEEIRRRDTIIMTLSQRIPELEAPASSAQASWRSSEPRDAPETVSETPEGVEVPTDRGDREMAVQRRSSWWRRFFGFK